MAAMMRPEADYDALDEARESQATIGPTEFAASPASEARAWAQYRGAQGDGVYREGELDLDWPASGPPGLWRIPVGPAYSSVVVAQGLVITMEQRRDREAVVAFSLGGSWVWEHAWPARFHEALSHEGPRATPAIDGDLVVAMGATGELRALDLEDGHLRWRRELTPAGSLVNLTYGLSASPRFVGDLVIAQGVDSVFGIERDTGEVRWRSLEEPLAYATPQVGELLGQPTLVVTTAQRIVGLAPETGRELWSFPWRVSDGLACTQPVLIGPNRVLVSGGYGKGSQLVELDGTLDPVQARSVWKTGRFRTRFNEPVRLGEYVYGFDDGTLACMEVATGERRWKSGAYGFGQLLATEEHLIVLDEEGHIHLLEANPEERVVLATFHALPKGLAVNLPTLAHGRLILRTDQEMCCYDLRPDAALTGP